jgi:phage-related holin
MKTKIMLYTFSFGALTSQWIEMLVDAQYQFIAILFVVLLDAFFGIAKAFKLGNFETKKTFKAVFMLVGFWLLLATVLTIEKGFPFASFLSEAILLPILLFQLISTLKNMHLVGLLNNEALAKILSNIDKHKDL